MLEFVINKVLVCIDIAGEAVADRNEHHKNRENGKTLPHMAKEGCILYNPCPGRYPYSHGIPHSPYSNGYIAYLFYLKGIRHFIADMVVHPSRK